MKMCLKKKDFPRINKSELNQLMNENVNPATILKNLNPRSFNSSGVFFCLMYYAPTWV